MSNKTATDTKAPAETETATAEDATAKAAEAAAEETAPATPSAEEQELQRLRSENQELRNRQPSAQPGRTGNITAAQLKNLPPSERERVEIETGMKMDDIILRVEHQEVLRSNQSTQAKLNVVDALDAAQEKDPQVHKLRAHMKEYLEDVSLEDKADPERLRRHIEKAKVFARGRLAERGTRTPPPAPGKGGSVKTEAPNPDAAGGDEDEDETAIKSGQELVIGNLRLRIPELPEKLKAREREIKHPTDPNGVMFARFDKPPMFNRG